MYPKAVTYLSAISLNERIRFLKILLRWQGSLWKLLWADFLWFLCAYSGITLLYRLYLVNDKVNKGRFEEIVKYMNQVATLVPLSFLLGFFVSTVLGRWWTIILSLPWMSKTSFTCQALITNGNPITCKDIRLSIVRYLNLSCILSLVKLSQTVKERFLQPESSMEKSNFYDCFYQTPPVKLSFREKMIKINEDSFVKQTFGNLIMEEEIRVFENLEKNNKKPNYFIPLMWASKLIERSYKAGFIKSNRVYLHLIEMIQEFRSNLGTLSVYNEFNMPLVYTQVIVLVVYIFLISELFTQQLVDFPSTNGTKATNLYIYIPKFGIFKFLIYMGWFKVGLSLINPFCGGSNEFPLNEIINFNLEFSSSISPADDSYFPEYLSEKFNEANENRFERMKKLQAVEIREKIFINMEPSVASGKYEAYHKKSPPDDSSEFELNKIKYIYT